LRCTSVLFPLNLVSKCVIINPARISRICLVESSSFLPNMVRHFFKYGAPFFQIWTTFPGQVSTNISSVEISKWSVCKDQYFHWLRVVQRLCDVCTVYTMYVLCTMWALVPGQFNVGATWGCLMWCKGWEKF